MKSRLMLIIQILTPADFALLNDLRLKAAKDLVDTTSSTSAKRKLAALEASRKHLKNGPDEAERFLTESEILGPQKKVKADYEERMESIRKGREGREKFASFKGKKKKVAPSSSTNREKARNKPIMMALQWVWVSSFSRSLAPLSVDLYCEIPQYDLYRTICWSTADEQLQQGRQQEEGVIKGQTGKLINDAVQEVS